jgi:hypothetical protein
MKYFMNKSPISVLFSQQIMLGICTLAMAATPSVSQAQNSIGVNFAGRQWSIGGNTPQGLASTDFAGVVGQQNWNNVDPAGHDAGTAAQITGPQAGVISDSSGLGTSVTLSYSGQGMWSANQSTSLTGNAQLMNGYSDVENSANGSYIFGNLSFNLYDVYVYVTADSNGRAAGVDLNGGAQTYLLTDANGYNYSTPLIQATASTESAATGAQYVLFQDVSGSGFTVDLHYYGNNVGVAAIQIVPVPEPSIFALSLAGLALAGLIRRRH